jgi:hypothetical protein
MTFTFQSLDIAFLRQACGLGFPQVHQINHCDDVDDQRSNLGRWRLKTETPINFQVVTTVFYLRSIA